MPGLPRDIIKKYGVSKRAWEVFRAGKSSRRKTKMPRRARFRYVSPRRSRSLARRFYPRLRRRRIKGPMPILPILGGVVGPLASAFADADVMGKLNANQPVEALKAIANEVSLRYCGYQPFVGYQTSPGWRFDKLIPTYTGLAAGIVGHYIASKFGVNRYMKRIPLVGKWVAL